METSPLPFGKMENLPPEFAGLDLEVRAPDRRITLSVDADKIPLCAKYCEEHHVDWVAINHFRGYRGVDIEFLRDFPPIKNLALVFPSSLRKWDIEPIYCHPQLNGLGLSDSIAVRLDHFPQLSEFNGESHRELPLHLCDNLKVLRLRGYSPKSRNFRIEDFPTGLTFLSLGQAKVNSLEGIEGLSALEELSLLYLRGLDSIQPLSALSELRLLKLINLPKLESMSPLTRLRYLRVLELDCCSRLREYEVLSEIASLRDLKISKCAPIPSLSFLDKMPPLEFFSFVDTNVEDGNMTPLFRQTAVGFLRKRHYSHTPEQVDAMIASRASIPT